MEAHRIDRNNGRLYGDAVARSLGIAAPPALRTRSLSGAQVGLTRLSCGTGQLGRTPEIPAEDSFVLALYLTELPHHELWSRGRKVLSQGYRQNAMRIVNLEARYSALIAAPHETVCFYIPRPVLDSFTDDLGSARVATLACPAGLVDPVVASLGAALLPAFARPDETSWLFLDQIAAALSAHVIDRYGQTGRPRSVAPGGLSVAKERRAKEYLAARFDEDPSIAEVAATCDLSRGHFLRAFKTATGVTPHRWLQRYRIETAQRLLLAPSVSIADIALKCGFADQSHLTRVFTSLVGISPGAWRKANLGAS